MLGREYVIDGADGVMCSTTVGVRHIPQQARAFIMEVYRQVVPPL